jgi:ADP-ribose pyrophosphatase YjhB (NUDIX family)
MADSTWHTVVGVVLRAREGRLEVLLRSGALPAAVLARGESLETALARAIDLAALAHLEQLETRVRADATLATAYLGLVRSDGELDGEWRLVRGPLRLGTDDAATVAAAQARLRAKLSYTNIGFALAPATFTISELRQVYVAALGHDVAATNLQRVLLRRGVLERIEGLRPPGRAGGRPAAVFRFASQRLEVTDAFATLRPPR